MLKRCWWWCFSRHFYQLILNTLQLQNNKCIDYVTGWNSEGVYDLPLFDGLDEENFGNNSARNLAIFSVYNSSSSHTNNPKNNFLVLSEEDTFGTNESLKVYWF